MPTKRAAPQVHPSRQDQVPDEPRRKKQKPDNAGPKSFKKAHPVNELKSELRSLKRLLQRNEDLPADVRVEKERALQSVQRELDETQKAQKKSDMIGKYHKIRFFDKQKATKRLKRARKELNSDAADKGQAELQQKVDVAEVDVNYAQYYPLDQHYVSLFPRKQGEEDGAEDGSADGLGAVAERKGDAKMWQRVKQCMAEGTLDALRNGRLMPMELEEKQGGVMASVPKVRRKKDPDVARKALKTRNGVSEARATERDEASDESDGGFFE